MSSRVHLLATEKPTPLREAFPPRSSLSTFAGAGRHVRQLRTQIVRARTNYWTAVNKIFHEDDPQVRNLTSQLNTAQISLDATIEHLNNVAKVLDAITKTVDIGAQIVEKAISLYPFGEKHARTLIRCILPSQFGRGPSPAAHSIPSVWQCSPRSSPNPRQR